MKRLLLLSSLLSFALACPPDGGGGGGGGGTVNFTQGFVFVKRSDRNIYVADKADYQKHQALTTSGNARQPSLSKDGKRVVFVLQSGTDTSIRSVPAAGGTVSTLFTSTATEKNLRNPVLSPDGTKIAFAFDSGSTSAIG